MDLGKRLKKDFKSLAKNRGVMNFTPSKTLGIKLTDEEIKSRESDGAKYTHKIKQSNTFEKIRKTIEDLQSKNVSVTLNSVWAHSGLSKNTIKKYKDIFFL